MININSINSSISNDFSYNLAAFDTKEKFYVSSVIIIIKKIISTDRIKNKIRKNENKIEICNKFQWNEFNF